MPFNTNNDSVPHQYLSLFCVLDVSVVISELFQGSHRSTQIKRFYLIWVDLSSSVVSPLCLGTPQPLQGRSTAWLRGLRLGANGFSKESKTDQVSFKNIIAYQFRMIGRKISLASSVVVTVTGEENWLAFPMAS